MVVLRTITSKRNASISTATSITSTYVSSTVVPGRTYATALKSQPRITSITHIPRTNFRLDPRVVNFVPACQLSPRAVDFVPTSRLDPRAAEFLLSSQLNPQAAEFVPSWGLPPSLTESPSLESSPYPWSSPGTPRDNVPPSTPSTSILKLSRTSSLESKPGQGEWLMARSSRQAKSPVLRFLPWMASWLAASNEPPDADEVTTPCPLESADMAQRCLGQNLMDILGL